MVPAQPCGSTILNCSSGLVKNRSQWLPQTDKTATHASAGTAVDEQALHSLHIILCVLTLFRE
eukprot:3327221-Rhodomonas_salina.1